MIASELPLTEIGIDREAEAGLLEGQAARDEDHANQLRVLKEKLNDAAKRLKRLYQAIESGVMWDGIAPAGVPSFVCKWRARKDSNLRPPGS